MKTLTRLGAMVACLSFVAAPASAGTGWISAGDGGLYRLDTAAGTASMVGLMAQPVSALAATAPSTMLGLQGNPGGQHLVSVDLTTATTTDRGQLDPSLVFAALTSTADGSVYAAAATDAQSQLFLVTADDASLTPVGEPQPGPGYQALAGACGGTLLGVDVDDNLVRISRATGASVTLGHIATASGEVVQALAFDHLDRTLWAVTGGVDGEHLLAVDPATGATTPTPYQSGQVGSGPLGLALDTPAACRYERRISAHYTARTQRFTGRLVGDWQSCTAGQKVRVYRRVPGPDQRLGSTTTKPDGRWTVSAAMGRGPAYAKAPDSRSPVTGRCLMARSALIR